jgi:hypothetical protein
MNTPRWLRWRSHSELDEEIDAHLEMEVQAHLDRGLTLDEARRAARLNFGNPAVVKQQRAKTIHCFALRALSRTYAIRYGACADRPASRSPRS